MLKRKKPAVHIMNPGGKCGQPPGTGGMGFKHHGRKEEARDTPKRWHILLACSSLASAALTALPAKAGGTWDGRTLVLEQTQRMDRSGHTRWLRGGQTSFMPWTVSIHPARARQPPPPHHTFTA